MKITYKALMLDLDGTTIKNQKEATPSEKVVQAISKAKKKVAVGVVTSRPSFWAMPVIKILSLNAPCVVAGGAQIIDPATKKIIWEKRIPQDEAEKIRSILTELKIPFVGPKRTHKGIIRPGFKITIPKEGQLEFGIPNIDQDKITLIKSKLSSLKNIEVQRTLGYEGEHDWIQITHINATKQYAIYEVAEILGIKPHEIIGVGDAYNDFPFLMACGLKIAMSNAVPELKAIADYIAPSIDDDGVADVIEKFIL